MRGGVEWVLTAAVSDAPASNEEAPTPMAARCEWWTGDDWGVILEAPRMIDDALDGEAISTSAELGDPTVGSAPPRPEGINIMIRRRPVRQTSFSATETKGEQPTKYETRCVLVACGVRRRDTDRQPRLQRIRWVKFGLVQESDVIAATVHPATVSTLQRNLESLGLRRDDVVIVHSSLSALGWVAGGAQAVVEALLAVVGSGGTIVMPSHSGHLSDPAAWANPPVPASWIDVLRDELPPFDPYLTPTREMGQIVDCFRQHRDTIRSSHPTVSFVANGPHAEAIVGTHPLTPALGESSPLGRLYDLDALILLLGVSHANDTSLHLAEHRANWTDKKTYTEGVPTIENGQRAWVTYEDLEPREDDFELIGNAFAELGDEHVGPVGAALGRLCHQQAVVDFAVTWMGENRPGSLAAPSHEQRAS